MGTKSEVTGKEHVYKKKQKRKPTNQTARSRLGAKTAAVLVHGPRRGRARARVCQQPAGNQPAAGFGPRASPSTPGRAASVVSEDVNTSLRQHLLHRMCLFPESLEVWMGARPVDLAQIPTNAWAGARRPLLPRHVLGHGEGPAAAVIGWYFSGYLLRGPSARLLGSPLGAPWGPTLPPRPASVLLQTEQTVHAWRLTPSPGRPEERMPGALGHKVTAPGTAPWSSGLGPTPSRRSPPARHCSPGALSLSRVVVTGRRSQSRERSTCCPWPRSRCPGLPRACLGPGRALRSQTLGHILPFRARDWPRM